MIVTSNNTRSAVRPRQAYPTPISNASMLVAMARRSKSRSPVLCSSSLFRSQIIFPPMINNRIQAIIRPKERTKSPPNEPPKKPKTGINNWKKPNRNAVSKIFFQVKLRPSDAPDAREAARASMDNPTPKRNASKICSIIIIRMKKPDVFTSGV